MEGNEWKMQAKNEAALVTAEIMWLPAIDMPLSASRERTAVPGSKERPWRQVEASPEFAGERHHWVDSPRHSCAASSDCTTRKRMHTVPANADGL